jgi:hypothetical protein
MWSAKSNSDRRRATENRACASSVSVHPCRPSIVILLNAAREESDEAVGSIRCRDDFRCSQPPWLRHAPAYRGGYHSGYAYRGGGYRHYGYRRGPGVGGALAAGAVLGIIGGVIAASQAPRYYYYPAPAYGYYGPGPSYSGY